jgi:hypothetical protein
MRFALNFIRKSYSFGLSNLVTDAQTRRFGEVRNGQWLRSAPERDTYIRATFQPLVDILKQLSFHMRQETKQKAYVLELLTSTNIWSELFT